VVQEAFLRLDLLEPGEVRDPRGWLTVVTSRLCLDRIRSAHNRRERPSDTAWLDSAFSLGRQAVIDPADRVTLDEEVSEALLILLQRLSSAERVSFVLHDVFQLPFDQVAEILGKPSATCRQLAKRARVKIAGGPNTTRRQKADQELHKISQIFLAACANGDLERQRRSAAATCCSVTIEDEAVIGMAPGRAPSGEYLTIADWPTIGSSIQAAARRSPTPLRRRSLRPVSHSGSRWRVPTPSCNGRCRSGLRNRDPSALAAALDGPA
jgi:RNA polymerase sigma factor (sigma-70 family)